MIKRNVMAAINITLNIKQDGKNLEFTIKPTGKAEMTTKVTIGGDPVKSKNAEGQPMWRKFTLNDKGQLSVELKVNTKSQEDDGTYDDERTETRVWELNGDKLTFNVTRKKGGETMSQIYTKK